MMRAGNIAILTYDDIIEGLLSDLRVLDLPVGATRLMIRQDAWDTLTTDLGLTDEVEEEDEGD